MGIRVAGDGRRAWARLVIAAAIASGLVCGVHATFAARNTAFTAGIGYLCWSLVFLGCSVAFWSHVRESQGAMRIRWSMMAGATLFAALGFLPSVVEVLWNTAPPRLLQTPWFNVSEALYMLAAVLFFAGVPRSIVIVDLLQALVFAVLRFNLIYSPTTSDHFNLDHLTVSQLMSLIFFLTAMVSSLGAASLEELKFLRVLAWFFGLRLAAYFMADQVSYVWTKHVHSSLWDAAGSVLLAGFAVRLFASGGAGCDEAAEEAPLRLPSVAVRSLTPSFLALVNLMLGLFVLRVSVRLAAAAISISLMCYVLRTVLLQAQAVKEKAALQSRNEHLEGLAVRDPLTGIGNRRSLVEAYGRLQNADGGQGLSLLLIDIDYFKQANDCHGHLYGDKVLVTLAKKLESLAASVPGSHCARLGGDEFALLLAGAPPQESVKTAERLRVLFSAHAFEAQGRRVSLSIGAASLEGARAVPLEALFSCADKALYRAKLLGRNRVESEPVRDAGAGDDPAAPAPRLKLQRAAG
jgi:diguanylate cyclase (GGDEF)-like protein